MSSTSSRSNRSVSNRSSSSSMRASAVHPSMSHSGMSSAFDGSPFASMHQSMHLPPPPATGRPVTPQRGSNFFSQYQVPQHRSSYNPSNRLQRTKDWLRHPNDSSATFQQRVAQTHGLRGSASAHQLSDSKRLNYELYRAPNSTSDLPSSSKLAANPMVPRRRSAVSLSSPMPSPSTRRNSSASSYFTDIGPRPSRNTQLRTVASDPSLYGLAAMSTVFEENRSNRPSFANTRSPSSQSTASHRRVSRDSLYDLTPTGSQSIAQRPQAIIRNTVLPAAVPVATPRPINPAAASARNGQSIGNWAQRHRVRDRWQRRVVQPALLSVKRLFGRHKKS